MHHFFEAITNTAGKSLIGYFARVINPTTQMQVTLASDDAGTPIQVVSGVANMAKTDEFGNLSLYVTPGTYNLDIYGPDATSFLFRVPNVAMNSSKGDPGGPGPQGEAGTINAFSTLAALLASPGSRQAAQLVPGAGESAPAGDFKYINGVWVRQSGAGIATTLGSGAPTRDVQANITARAVNMRDEGAVLDRTTDDSAAFVRALARGREIVLPGKMYINTTVALPDGVKIIGFGPQVSEIVLGPNGRLQMEGPGFTVPADPNTLVSYGRACFRDFGITTDLASLSSSNINFWKVRDIEFANMVFYHVWVNLDNHRYITFNKCRFYGGISNSRLLSQCSYQPTGGQWINENLSVVDCFSSGFPWEIIDTVEPHFLNSKFFEGAYGIWSRRVNATGDSRPFYMGPIVTGCTFDAIRGVALDVDGGGTNCRVVGNFFSTGRFDNVMGCRFTNSQGVEFFGNHLEWCGATGLVLATNCANFSILGNTFLNMKAGNGITASTTTGLQIMGNVFENRDLFGGSEQGNTQLAIETPASDLTNSVVIGNRVIGMKNAVGMYVEGAGTRVFANPGSPVITERNWAPQKSGGWTAATGPAYRGAYTSYAGQTQGAAYSQVQAQAVDDALRTTSQRLKAVEDALRANSLIDG